MKTFIYRLYQFIIVLPLGLVLTLLTAIITIIGTHFNPRFFGYYPAKWWSKIILSLLLLKVEVEGKENLKDGESYVFVANHQGSMDIFLVYGYLNNNFKWVMKSDLKKVPFVGYACQRANHVFVDRKRGSNMLHSIDQSEEILKSGVSLFIFPEGRRTENGRLGRFRKGAYWLAKELKLKIVPVTIQGSYEVLPRTKGFWFVNRRTLSLHISTPILTCSSDTLEDLMNTSRNEIESILNDEIKKNY